LKLEGVVEEGWSVQKFYGDAVGLYSRGGWEEKAGNEKFFYLSLSIVAKL
jgi:hypothetical protein